LSQFAAKNMAFVENNMKKI